MQMAGTETGHGEMERTDPKASVIIPVFNAGKWLRGAIDSVLSQTYRDFELLLIDDGATDGSGAVCDEYAALDGRVRVFHRPNAGICATRNFGIEEARGKYICFCDHDDLYEPDYLECAVGAAEASGCKIVKFDHTTETRTHDDIRHIVYAGAGRVMADGVFAVGDLSAYENRRRFDRIRSVIWDALFERKFLLEKGLRFDESFRHGGEDGLFMLAALAAADRVQWVDRVLYRHFENVGVSISTKFHPELVADYLTTAKMERALFPCGIKGSLWRFWKWYAALDKFVFSTPACTLGFGERAQIVASFYQTILAGIPAEGVDLPWKSRLALKLLGRGHCRLYLFFKELGFAARKPSREKRRRQAEARGVGTMRGTLDHE